MQQFNFPDTYLRPALAFIGLNDIELITVGVATSERKLLTAQSATRWPRCLPSPLDLFEVHSSMASSALSVYCGFHVNFRRISI